MQKTRSYIYMVAFLLFVLAIWLLLAFIPTPEVVDQPRQDGVISYTLDDFNGRVYYLHDHWDSIPEQLYTPQELASEGMMEQLVHLDSADYQRYQYITHVLQIALPKGKTYSISMKTPDYAMRLYINGEEVDTVGLPTDSAQTNVPRVLERTYTFMPQTDVTTLVVHSSNYVHREGAYSPNFHIGLQQDIATLDNHSMLINFLLMGSLLTAFLYHLGLFALNRSRYRALVFSFCCLLLGLMSNKLSLLFFPDYNWFVLFRLEYLVHFATFAVLLLFLNLVFSGLLHRYVSYAYYGLAAIYMLLTLFLPTATISRLLVGFEAVSVGMIAYVLICLGLRLRERNVKTLLAFLGVFLVCLFGVNDILYSNDIIFIGRIAGQMFTTPIAMVFFVYCYTLVLSIENAETEQAMLLAQQQVREAEERYQNMLLQLEEEQRPHISFADFGLSARETDVAWLLLDGKTRIEISDMLGLSIGTVNTYCSRIYKKTGSNSVGELSRLMRTGQTE